MTPAHGPPPRLVSVDALRGCTVAAMLLVNTPGDWSHVFPPLLHAAWHGFTPTDLVFPLFLFIVGVSIALGPLASPGQATPAQARAVWSRAGRLVALGLLLHLCAWLATGAEAFRPMGVLQRIGLCYLAVTLLAMHAGARAQGGVFWALLVGYGGLLALGGSLDPHQDIASRIDTAVFGRHAYLYDPATGLGHEPEGLASTLGAIASTLLGLRAGAWLRAGDVPRLWLTGVAAMALGLLLAPLQPINKALWTPAYVLFSGGLSLWLLALAHRLIDRRGWPPLGRRFGVNAITVYAGAALMVYALIALGWLGPAYHIGFASWIAPLAGERAASLAFALAFVTLWWGIAWWMDARRWYVRI